MNLGDHMQRLEVERLALVGLSPESIENADVFDTTHAELIDTCLHSQFFTRGEDR